MILLNFTFIFLFGIIGGKIFEKIKLPKILGMLLAGICIGPAALNLLSEEILLLAPTLRQVALIIILFRAGLSLDLTVLKQIGKSAIFMSFVPAAFEILGIVCLAPLLFGISLRDALLIGSVLAAVSPAIIVPKMLDLMKKGYGNKNKFRV